MAAIIFDFDGTIADSFDFVVTFLAAGVKLPPLGYKEKQELRGLSMTVIARRLGYSWWRLPFRLVKGRRKMNGSIKQLQPFDGMAAVIRGLHADGHQLFIVSSNSVRNIRAFLRQHGLEDYFLEITGNVGLFGKAGALRRLLKKHRLQPATAVYIGDELRDVQAAQSIKLPIIAVSWGFARPNDLTAARPTAVAKAPAELTKVIKSFH
jgi:phosphoglycolate phosphatase